MGNHRLLKLISLNKNFKGVQGFELILQTITKYLFFTDITPLKTSPPKVINDANRSSNISDVVVIETSNVHIVENKAVVPLAIFLVVALVLLFVVVLRLRVMKSRLRRKAFATDDADYLINGMYL